MDVKVCLQVNGEVKEIRRFQTERWTYESIHSKIMDIFSVTSTFKMCYKDREGDLVAFSTEDELKHGLKFLTQNTLRVFAVYPYQSAQELLGTN